ncbi:MAG: hypothetical protein P0Y53_21885 [Candidatus Pseudobacter hemicellulosilyticus]|uniref:Uncharacterized protein n=1 Tax=Candidatus Pseudobacter hemicellulosilyticus TaxID=3121375 RepID=A0AAJ6BGS5_9BACT|nr:MAG: hypothetical protein P0Y53_21885 [Pseudobacter sp.]
MKKLKKQREKLKVNFSKEEINPFNLAIANFVNGQSLEELKEELEHLKLTTITECYGELDKGKKWLLMDFFERLHELIPAAFYLNQKQLAIALNPICTESPQ